MAAFTIVLTHDVDRVQKTFQYLTHDIYSGRLSGIRGLWANRDPYWMFEEIMSIEDMHGVRSTFFFLEESIRPKCSSIKSWVLAFGRYRFDNPAVRAIIRALDNGGWEIGLHGSYNSYRSLDLLKREKARLEGVLGKAIIGGRQHYLNLDVPETWQLQRQAGLAYDATFGYVRGIGWRNDKYHPFRDLRSGMYVIPLTLMECNLFSAAKRPREAWEICNRLMDEAERQRAVLSVLWHQRMFNELDFPGYGAVYRQLIAEGVRRGAEFLTCRQVYERAQVNDGV